MKDDSLLDNQESEQSTFDPTKVKVVDKWPGGKYHAEMIDYAPSAEELGILFLIFKQTNKIHFFRGLVYNETHWSWSSSRGAGKTCVSCIIWRIIENNILLSSLLLLNFYAALRNCYCQ